jgi:hypothetical protein
LSLTFARTSAANSINKRIRLRAEVDRLRHEVVLLREEIRIKNVRMELVHRDVTRVYSSPAGEAEEPLRG